MHKSRLPVYWFTDGILSTPILNQVKRDRFLLLVRFFHFADIKYNPADPDRDKLYDRDVINMIKDRCGKVYSPGKSLSMGESLVLSKGRLGFNQYISSKRTRFGIKLYQLCIFNGILLDFIVYCENLEPELISLENCLLITEGILATVMQKYLNKGHHLFIDNYYTSLSSAEYLMQNGTYVTSEHFPVEMKELRLEKGDAAFYQHEDVVVAKYRAKKDRTNGKQKEVYALSTAHAPAMGHTVKRDKDGNIITKPTCIISYNHNMGGVDMMDQQLDAIDVIRKSYKWYKKLFLRLVMQCSLSAHKLFKLQGGKDDFLHFLLGVGTHLLINASRLERLKKRTAVDSIARLTGRNHWPAKRETPAEWKAATSRVKNCRVCTARGKKMRGEKEIKTAWIYKDCSGEPGLCVDKECFELYHTKFDFSQ